MLEKIDKVANTKSFDSEEARDQVFQSFCEFFGPDYSPMCKSPVSVSPATHVVTGTDNSSITSTDLTHSVYSAINVNITTSVIFIILAAVIILTIFVLQAVNKSHIFDLHRRITEITDRDSSKESESNQTTQC